MYVYSLALPLTTGEMEDRGNIRRRS